MSFVYSIIVSQKSSIKLLYINVQIINYWLVISNIIYKRAKFHNKNLNFNKEHIIIKNICKELRNDLNVDLKNEYILHLYTF